MEYLTLDLRVVNECEPHTGCASYLKIKSLKRKSAQLLSLITDPNHYPYVITEVVFPEYRHPLPMFWKSLTL